MQKWHINNCLDVNKISFLITNIITVFLFVTAVMSLVVTTIVIYIVFGHTKLKSLVTSIALQQIREADALAEQEHVSMMHDIECTYPIQWYIIVMLVLVI